MANCRVCGIELTLENWWPSSQRKHDYICNPCNTERMKNLQDANRGHYREYHHHYYLTHQGPGQPYDREYRRNHVLIASNHVKLVGNKRPYPVDGKCELCGRKPQKLGYHHYDDNDLQKGLWLCAWCHGFAERLDEGYSVRYIALRKKFEI